MILAVDSVDHGQYLVEHVLVVCGVSGGASCASEQGEWPETGLLWVRDGHWGSELANQRPVLGQCWPISGLDRVWAPVVSRATDHHHQKPLISLLVKL